MCLGEYLLNRCLNFDILAPCLTKTLSSSTARLYTSTVHFLQSDVSAVSWFSLA